jgi:uncharacterized protein (DUF736 family)
MKITTLPTLAVVTIGNDDASVNIEIIALTESIDDKLCACTERTPDERKSFRRWIKTGTIGACWHVMDTTGDTVGSVVLV